MTIKALFPRAPAPPKITEQCCVDVASPVRKPTWRQVYYGHKRPDQDSAKCMRSARYHIDGRPYCTVHAGRVALDMWVSGKLTEVE